jgi:cellobiose-specific phosphotransferase system component IIA
MEITIVCLSRQELLMLHADDDFLTLMTLKKVIGTLSPVLNS